MKLKPGFILHRTEKEAVLVSRGGSSFNGIVEGNGTLGEILAMLKKGTTEEEMLAGLKAKFNGSEEAMARDIRKALAELRSIDALEE